MMKRLWIGYTASLVSVISETSGIMIVYRYHHGIEYGACDKSNKKCYDCDSDYIYDRNGPWSPWRYYCYYGAVQATILSFLFLKPIVGKDVARIIAEMVYKSRYDFVWEPTFTLGQKPSK